MGVPSSVEAQQAGSGREGAHMVEMQRRRLLLAMQELAGEVGLGDATVGAVCKRSRVSRRTFYELFEDREDCFLAAFEDTLEQIAESVLPAYEGETRTRRAHGTQRSRSWRERIRASLEALLVLFDEQPSLARLCVLETPKGGRAVLARRRELLSTLAATVDEGRAEARAGPGPPTLTAEGAVGGVLAVIHARLLQPDSGSLVELTPALTGMIVLPYLGLAASQREQERPVTVPNGAGPANNGKHAAHVPADPFRDMPIRVTYRTARVLAVIAAHPGASNRKIGDGAGASDQGQVSKLLKRLAQAGMIENQGPGNETGEPNAWKLTPRGQAIHTALGTGTS
jgi:AcrR family transcriptional regulator